MADPNVEDLGLNEDPVLRALAGENPQPTESSRGSNKQTSWWAKFTAVTGILGVLGFGGISAAAVSGEYQKDQAIIQQQIDQEAERQSIDCDVAVRHGIANISADWSSSPNIVRERTADGRLGVYLNNTEREACALFDWEEDLRLHADELISGEE